MDTQQPNGQQPQQSQQPQPAKADPEAIVNDSLTTALDAMVGAKIIDQGERDKLYQAIGSTLKSYFKRSQQPQQQQPAPQQTPQGPTQQQVQEQFQKDRRRNQMARAYYLRTY